MVTNVKSMVSLPASQDYYFVHCARNFRGYDFLDVYCFNAESKFYGSFYVVPSLCACFGTFDEVRAFLDDLAKDTQLESEVSHD